MNATPEQIRYDFRKYTALQVANLYNVLATASMGDCVYRTEYSGNHRQYRQDVPYIRDTQSQLNRQAWKLAEDEEMIERRIDRKDCVPTAKGMAFLKLFAVLDPAKRPAVEATPVRLTGKE